MAKSPLEICILGCHGENKTGVCLENRAKILDKLRASIGAEATLKGRRCQLVEILEDGPQVVLQCIEKRSVIQPDQYGEAHRRVPETTTVYVFEPDGKSVNPFLVELGLLKAGSK